MKETAKILQALLFLSPEPVALADLARAVEKSEEDVQASLDELGTALSDQGLDLCEVAAGFTLRTVPAAEAAARRLFANPRPPSLTPAQAETLAIVAYLQPVSRPEVARIRGVASESATLALVERGLIEESGRSEHGAVMYRTTPLFLKLFDLPALDGLPDLERWDPSPQEQAELRQRLLSAGDARAGKVTADRSNGVPVGEAKPNADEVTTGDEGSGPDVPNEVEKLDGTGNKPKTSDAVRDDSGISLGATHEGDLTPSRSERRP